jgi:HPt (histidine-containing phosphotransfer) domain-containing protein
LVSDNAILDLSRLHEAFEDDTAGIVELLEMALGTGERHIIAMRDALAKHDAAAMARTAHSIKGSASNIGALHVAQLGEAMEESTRDERWTDIERLASDLDAAYDELRESIAGYRAKVTPPVR